VVVDPENGRVGARRNERHIERRSTEARGLARIVAALNVSVPAIPNKLNTWDPRAAVARRT
jgi:hypothetical protein